MKLLIFFLLTLSIHAEIGTYLYTKNTRCIFELQPNQNDDGFCYRYSNNPNTQRCTRTSKLTHFIKGYDYNTSTGKCELEHDLQIAGLDKELQSNIMIYISAAFSLAFFSILFMLVI